jgi:hypothetical protein
MRWPLLCLSYSYQLRPKLKDGRVHKARVLYQPPRLRVYVDDMEEPVQAVSVDLADILGGDGTAWVGFTSATGGGWENHDLLSWKFDPTPQGTADSIMTTVSSTISYSLGPCLPDRKLCTPEDAVVLENGPGQYHVYLPANREWGASVPNPSMAPVRAVNVKGIVCWDPRIREGLGCNGPEGNGMIPGNEVEGEKGFVAPHAAAGSLVGKSLNGRAYFTVNDRAGTGFKDNEGYFEFDVIVGEKK